MLAAAEQRVRLIVRLRCVVAAAAREGLTRRPVVQYRARRANTASLAVATRTGFTHYCDGLVIHLSP